MVARLVTFSSIFWTDSFPLGDCANSLVNNESKLLLKRVTWLFTVTSNWIHSIWSRHVTDTLAKNFRNYKNKPYFNEGIPFRGNSPCKFVRPTGRIFLWSYRWPKYPSPGSTRTFFLLKWHNKSFSMVQFIPQIPHNFNISRTLSESLVIALMTAFIWNSEVTFLLVSIIWRNTMCTFLQILLS